MKNGQGVKKCQGLKPVAIDRRPVGAMDGIGRVGIHQFDHAATPSPGRGS